MNICECLSIYVDIFSVDLDTLYKHLHRERPAIAGDLVSIQSLPSSPAVTSISVIHKYPQTSTATVAWHGSVWDFLWRQNSQRFYIVSTFIVEVYITDKVKWPTSIFVVLENNGPRFCALTCAVRRLSFKSQVPNFFWPATQICRSKVIHNPATFFLM